MNKLAIVMTTVCSLLTGQLATAQQVIAQRSAQRHYEQNNQLANVLSVVNDKKVLTGSTHSTQVAQPTVVAHRDYFPFGFELPTRTQSTSYRFGFQGEEQDPEWLQGATAFKYRVHDPRVGRFLSLDPLAPQYAHNAPYAFSENRLIDAIELEGLESTPTGKDGSEKHEPKPVTDWDDLEPLPIDQSTTIDLIDEEEMEDHILTPKDVTGTTPTPSGTATDGSGPDGIDGDTGTHGDGESEPDEGDYKDPKSKTRVKKRWDGIRFSIRRKRHDLNLPRKKIRRRGQGSLPAPGPEPPPQGDDDKKPKTQKVEGVDPPPPCVTPPLDPSLTVPFPITPAPARMDGTVIVKPAPVPLMKPSSGNEPGTGSGTRRPPSSKGWIKSSMDTRPVL